jgi:hypothetical protein
LIGFAGVNYTIVHYTLCGVEAGMRRYTRLAARRPRTAKLLWRGAFGTTTVVASTLAALAFYG